MRAAGFPPDEYTPHGYLANPFAVAHSWSEGEGGCLRTTRDYVGMGWQFPWALHAEASVDLVVMLEAEGQRLVRRADFERHGLVSPHHSAILFSYRWEAFGRTWTASFVLVDARTLGVEVEWSASTSEDPGQGAQPIRLTVGLVGWQSPDGPQVSVDPSGRQIDFGPSFGAFDLGGDNAWIERPEGYFGIVRIPTATPAPALVSRPGQVAISWSLDVLPGRSSRAHGVARRLRSPSERIVSRSTSATVRQAIGRALVANDAFWAGAARLEGDWPPAWRRGWVYDVETTRMCVYPAGGIFTDVWPAWMVQWPRAVVAEGTLDMARLAYASPDLALRTTLSLFRDAAAPNVPCVFQHGEPNMVAADGAVCGTSPAWCIPFYNLERLFALTLDRDWLAAIYPYLAAYLDWWLQERTDADGWAVYKCTWEAGEDDTPRLDPERRGDNVVSAFVRPVELQATMALSAGVLARFATILGQRAEVARWQRVEADYLTRTRTLWDPVEGRFRDWDARAGRFLAPAGEANYWGIDPCRYSALAFTPLLAGLHDEAIREGLRRELQQYDGPPWTLWASWSYVVLEAAHRTGDDAFAGRVASDIVGRVYGELDARQIVDPRHPTPGVSREYWPLDLDTWASCEGYGWGANTAALLVRQVFGFLEGPYVNGPGTHEAATTAEGHPPSSEWRAPVLAFHLRPSLPADLLIPGKTYRLVNVPYRGGRLSLGYRVDGAKGARASGRCALALIIAADVPTQCRVAEVGADGQHISDGSRDCHEISGQNGAVYHVTLSPANGDS